MNNGINYRKGGRPSFGKWETTGLAKLPFTTAASDERLEGERVCNQMEKWSLVNEI